MAFSPVDDRLADEFEQLLRAGGKTGELQDKMAEAVKWTEGRLLSEELIHHLQASARSTLRRFLMEQPRYTAMGGMTPEPHVADDLTVTHDGQGHVTINLPTEVRRWLLQTQSAISC